MMHIPWTYMKSWNCIACGICCKDYQVVLGFNEWVKIIRKYGIGVTQPGISKFYLEKKGDGTCVFLTRYFDTWLCGLQNMKPKACKLWPFKVLSKPKYGRRKEAAYKYGEQRFFVYVDPACVGIRWGRPKQEFMSKILPEFIEISLGQREKQSYSTSKIVYYPYFNIRRGKRV